MIERWHGVARCAGWVYRLRFLDANTNTSGGLYVMMTQMFNVANGDRPHVPDTAIVITDGRSTYDANLTVPYANEAKARGIRIIGTIATPPRRHKYLLNALI